MNAFSASGIAAGFIPTTEVSTGISRLPIIRLIHFRLKSVEHISTMRFRYGMYMCIGIRVANNVGGNSRPIDRNEGLSIGLLFYCRLLFCPFLSCVIYLFFLIKLSSRSDDFSSIIFVISQHLAQRYIIGQFFNIIKIIIKNYRV